MDMGWKIFMIIREFEDKGRRVNSFQRVFLCTFASLKFDKRVNIFWLWVSHDFYHFYA